ncbi:hypothetical protein [Enterobacter sp. Bisph1]|uniref:hypothetical protein n=1 Tax=Enterobacter sp. Bisph1 TaxID=1274399 RepID=UPI00057C2BBE|nr:hypothetical protein [Enterobacter sp. Bisph1]
MSKRSDIIDGQDAYIAKYGLIYTELLGWIDLGHAQGNDIKKLLSQMELGEASKMESYDVRYTQGMTAPFGVMRSGKVMSWKIRRGRPYWEREQIALAMMISMSYQFEAFQGAFPNNIVTDSSFSGEDLVSNLLGFYRVISQQNPFPQLLPISKEEALERWDYYGEIGQWKNKTFEPLLFPDPKENPHARPLRGTLPPFMRTVIPYNDFKSDKVTIPLQDKTFIILGSRSGRMGL